jgi:hypothetical protein
VVNTGSSAVSLGQITLKFWIDDTTGQPLVGAVDYGGGFGSTNQAVNGVAINAVNFSPACGPDSDNQANWEITVSDTDTRSLSAGATWSGIQAQIHLANFANFSNSSIWYSPCGVGSGSTYTNNVYYAVYYQGNLVTASGGVPPSCRPLPTCTPNGGGKALKETSMEGVTPTETPTPIPARGALLGPVVAAPNLSTGGQPIRFLMNLGQPAPIRLSLFALTGELVYTAQAEGGEGLDSLVWNLQNHSGAQVASGLYIYVLTASDGTSTQTQTGKVVVIH